MSSTYPEDLDDFPTNRSNSTASSGLHPADHNNVFAAINAIEATLGTNPQAGGTSLADRLAHPASLNVAIPFQVSNGGFTVQSTILFYALGTPPYSGTVVTTVTTPPFAVNSNSHVTQTPASDVSGLPTDATDEYDLSASMMVSNQAGTETIILTCLNHTTTGDAGLALDWSTASVALLVGSDLSLDGNQVLTAAGGVFTATIVIAGGWD